MAGLTPEQQQAFARQRLGLQSEADLNKRRLQEDYSIFDRRLGEETQRGVTNVGDQMASQGLFGSGIRVNEQGNVVREANERRSQLNLDRTRGFEDISRGLATGLANVDVSAASALAQANREEQARMLERARLEAQSRQVLPPPPPPPAPITMEQIQAMMGEMFPQLLPQQQLQKPQIIPVARSGGGRVNF